MTDDEFIESFQDCSLAVECFHHADHVRMAFLHLSRYPPLQAIQRFSHSLAKFVAAHDKPTLYHETITWAFLLLIRERMARAGHQRTRVEFSANNKDLLTWENSVLKKYYRDETLSSTLARSTFLLPDKVMTEP